MANATPEIPGSAKVAGKQFRMPGSVWKLWVCGSCENALVPRK